MLLHDSTNNSARMLQKKSEELQSTLLDLYDQGNKTDDFYLEITSKFHMKVLPLLSLAKEFPSIIPNTEGDDPITQSYRENSYKNIFGERKNTFERLINHISHAINTIKYHSLVNKENPDKTREMNSRQIHSLIKTIENEQKTLGDQYLVNPLESVKNFLSKVKGKKEISVTQTKSKNLNLESFNTEVSEFTKTANNLSEHLSNKGHEEQAKLLNFHIKNFIVEVKKYNTQISNSSLPNKSEYIDGNTANIMTVKSELQNIMESSKIDAKKIDEYTNKFLALTNILKDSLHNVTKIDKYSKNSKSISI